MGLQVGLGEAGETRGPDEGAGKILWHQLPAPPPPHAGAQPKSKGNLIPNGAVDAEQLGAGGGPGKTRRD